MNGKRDLESSQENPSV